ncbi:hypothetical protein M011DRAFT_512577 [Sporormia fimetaria CBS 119925]|uniref:Uncharacterized protein n=1 Tax=Sporormia fimetaria CBS 119925 TaxID=1340428 RepID=A0A6A6UVP6_9PLEO|nr:hypothetical protein M011DRAFT_512577 [Sporormia fimetaria CBS 119925]
MSTVNDAKGKGKEKVREEEDIEKSAGKEKAKIDRREKKVKQDDSDERKGRELQCTPARKSQQGRRKTEPKIQEVVPYQKQKAGDSHFPFPNLPVLVRDMIYGIYLEHHEDGPRRDYYTDVGQEQQYWHHSPSDAFSQLPTEGTANNDPLLTGASDQQMHSSDAFLQIPAEDANNNGPLPAGASDQQSYPQELTFEWDSTTLNPAVYTPVPYTQFGPFDSSDPFHPYNYLGYNAPPAISRRGHVWRRLEGDLHVLEEVEVKLVDKPYGDGHISDATYKAYCKYAAEYAIGLKRYTHVTEAANFPADKHLHCNLANNPHGKVEIPISIRGNFCFNLPPLCLVNRQSLGEVLNFGLGDHLQLTATVANFNYRPLFRLCRLLNRANIPIRPSQVTIKMRFSDDRSRTFDQENLTWLFTKHWFEEYPLWHPTLLDGEIADDQTESQYCEGFGNYYGTEFEVHDENTEDEYEHKHGTGFKQREEKKIPKEGRRKDGNQEKERQKPQSGDQKEEKTEERKEPESSFIFKRKYTEGPKGLLEMFMIHIRQAAHLWRKAPHIWMHPTVNALREYRKFAHVHKPIFSPYLYKHWNRAFAEEAIKMVAHGVYLCLRQERPSDLVRVPDGSQQAPISTMMVGITTQGPHLRGGTNSLSSILS